MAGKTTVICSRRLHYALDNLSKNTLIDILVDRAKLETGNDNSDDATDEQIADVIQEWAAGVTAVRADRCPDFRAAIDRIDRSDAGYRARAAACG